MTKALTPTDRTRLKRLPQRGSYDVEIINAVLDTAPICHVAFVLDGQPYALPMAFGRVADQIYLHASAAGRLARSTPGGLPLCVTVTHLDGLVLARSAFHHSMNYRSVMVVGDGRIVSDPAEREVALRAVVDHVVRGRWDEVRQPSDRELKATAVIALPLSEASAKIRTGGPIDDEEDYGRAVWAGVVPVTMTAGGPQQDSRVAPGVDPFDVGRLDGRL